MLCPKLLSLLLLIGVAFASLQDVNNAVRSGKTPMKAVALGGWLVAEHWMTTSSPAWQGVPDSTANGGEYVTMKYLGHERGDKQFKAHRDNFITEQDFLDIANAGLNTVRITVGYWIVGFDNSGGGDTAGWQMYAPGGLDYVDRAVREWGPRHNILVFLSFHGAKGSQNGQDHSGPENPGHAYWAQYQENVNNSLDAVEWLAKRYKDDAAFLGIGLLNEPTGQDINVLKQYYYDAYGRIRNNVKSDMLLTVSPLIDQQYNNGDWNKFMTGSNYYNLRMEWHPYYVWGYEGQTPDQIIAAAANYKNLVASWDGIWLFFGEWSLAAACPMTDDQIKTYSSTQLDSFSPNTARGWSFWAWKQYGDDGSYKNGWSMKSMLRYGFLPHF